MWRCYVHHHPLSGSQNLVNNILTEMKPRRWLIRNTVHGKQLKFIPKECNSLVLEVKIPFIFAIGKFILITFKPLKTDLLWATRLIIDGICFCSLGYFSRKYSCLPEEFLVKNYILWLEIFFLKSGVNTSKPCQMNTLVPVKHCEWWELVSLCSQTTFLQYFVINVKYIV